MILFSLLAFVIMFGMFLTFELRRNYLIALYLKGLTSLTFLMLALSFLFESGSFHQFALFILIGLTFGLLGDIYLALRPLRDPNENETIIILGISVFSLGHVSYLIALSLLNQFSVLSIGFGILMMFGVIILSRYMKFQMGKTRYFNYAYAALIFTMIGQSIVYVMNGGPVFLMIGACLFGVSDLILAPIYFKKMDTKWMVALNLVTYYVAQIFIASSLYFYV